MLKILNEIGVCSDDKRIIEVINKVDLIENQDFEHNSQKNGTIFLSAATGFGISNLKNRIKKSLISENFSLFKQSY